MQDGTAAQLPPLVPRVQKCKHRARLWNRAGDEDEDGAGSAADSGGLTMAAPAPGCRRDPGGRSGLCRPRDVSGSGNSAHGSAVI